MVFLQDALLPPDPRWQFMERYKWRVRMARFKGVPSECVVLPLGAIPGAVGDDIAQMLGVTKYEKPVPLGIAGDMVGAFPSFLPKTDEPNFQTVDFGDLMESIFYVTEKADGTSCTAWVDEGGLHVASRNWELREFSASGAKNLYWETARKYTLQDMPVGMAVQFEIVGPGVQSNPMGLQQIEGRIFGMFERDEQGRWIRSTPGDFSKAGIPLAKDIACEQRPLSADELRKLAEIKYANGKHGEGIVVRAADQSWSFKVINLLYKD
jgi:RNA ligase (TIGR02306 family)